MKNEERIYHFSFLTFNFSFLTPQSAAGTTSYLTPKKIGTLLPSEANHLVFSVAFKALIWNFKIKLAFFEQIRHLLKIWHGYCFH